MLGLGRKVDEDAMQGTSGYLNYFSIVVVAAAQTNGHLKISISAIDLKCDANLRTGMAAAGRLNPCHLYLKFAHC
jgi:hypothetical protein